MTQSLILKQGDQKPEVEVQLLQQSANGGTEPVDLSGASVKFYVVDPDTNELLINGENVTIVDAQNGEIRYQWTSGDVDEYGFWKGEFVATFSDGDLTFPNTGFIDVIINPDAQGGL
jgi:hypothetical protein